MDKVEFPEESDSSDEDYLPTTGEAVSEVESDGDPEEPLSDSEESSKKGRKRQKKGTTKRKTKLGNIDENVNDSTKSTKKPDESEEDRKKRADSLWDSFKQDTGFKVKSNTKETMQTISEESAMKNKAKPMQQERVKVKKVFEFAGEEVVIEKDVAADSAEARLFLKPATSSVDNVEKSIGNIPSKRPSGLGGISSVLTQLGKKQKLSTLEKTKLDWDSFKKKENIEEELESYKKGKNGYLEKQDFLERADLRKFEIERGVREIERNKRLNLNVD